MYGKGKTFNGCGVSGKGATPYQTVEQKNY